MTQKCSHCDRAATLFLCTRCQSELRDMLTGLAIGQELPNGQRGTGWIEHLAEAALGQTRLGESARRSPRYRRRLDGDRELASQIELLPGEQWVVVQGPARDGEPWPVKVPADVEANLGKARRDRERMVLQHALGAAKINVRAAELLEYTHAVLGEWIRDLCETRGVECPTISVTAELALWLARNVSSIASDEGAKVCYREIQQIVTDIEWAINRPIPQLPLGKCPSGAPPCGFALEGRRAAAEVVCPKCKTSHKVEELLARLVNEADDYLYTMAELVQWALPTVREYVSDRTLRHWCAKGKLQPRGHGPDGEPRYLLDDVRRLRAKRPQTEPTGAGMHKRAI